MWAEADIEQVQEAVEERTEGHQSEDIQLQPVLHTVQEQELVLHIQVVDHTEQQLAFVVVLEVEVEVVLVLVLVLVLVPELVLVLVLVLQEPVVPLL